MRTFSGRFGRALGKGRSIIGKALDPDPFEMEQWVIAKRSSGSGCWA